MTTAPLVSCIVPVWNGERYLGQAIDSILSQVYRPLEILVVDDGSTDGTADVVARYWDPVRYMRQENAGPSTARNHGLREAGGAFVAFLDADDLWLPGKLTAQMDRFRARPELDICVTHFDTLLEPEAEPHREHFRHRRFVEPVPGYATTTLLARRSVFDRVGPFDETIRFGVNLEWFLRVAESGAVVELMGEVMVHRRLHDRNRSSRMAAASLGEHLRLIKASLDRRRARNPEAPESYPFQSGPPGR